MAENREYLTRAEENGSINIAEDVVAAIAADAIGEIEGVGSMCQNMTEQITEQFTGKKGLRGVRAEVKDGEIIVDVYLMVRYGYAIPETASEAAKSIETLASYTLSEAQIENMVTAKGYEDCVVFMSEDGVSVVVSTGEEGLQTEDIARITDIVKQETGLSAESINIMEVN